MEGLRLEGLADVHRPVSADAHEAGPKPDRVSGFFSPQVPSRRSSQWAANNGKVSGRENLGNIVSSAPKRRSSTAWEESQVLSSAPMNQHSDLVSSVSSPKSGVASPKRLSMQRSSTMRASKESSLSKPSEGPDSAAQIVRERRGTLESYSPRTQMELMDHPLGEFLLPILPPNEGENGHGSLPTRTSNVKHYYGVAAKRRSSYQGGAPVAPVLPVKHPPALAQFLDSAGAKPNDIQNVEADAAASKERIAEKVAERRQSYAGFGLRDPGSPKRQGGRLSVKASSNQRRASEAPGADPSSFAFRLPYQLKPRRVWTLEEAFRTVREGAEDLASEDFPTEGEARWLGAGGAAEWRPCMVLGYDRGDHKYWVQWLAPRPGDSDACARRFQVARMNLRIGNLGEGGHSWQKPREATGGVEKRLGKLGGLGEKRTGRGGALREGDGGGMAAILAELAEEYAGESRQPEAWKQEGEAENGEHLSSGTC